MKNWIEKDLVVPCIDCGKLPDVEWECDDLVIKCKEGCCVSIWRGLNATITRVSTMAYFLEQVNMWNRAHTVHEEQTDPQDAA